MTQNKEKRNDNYTCDKHKVRRRKSIKFGILWLFQRVKHETKKTGKEGFPDQSQQAYIKDAIVKAHGPKKIEEFPFCCPRFLTPQMNSSY